MGAIDRTYLRRLIEVQPNTWKTEPRVQRIPDRHKDTAAAWAQGSQVAYKSPASDTWNSIGSSDTPSWLDHIEYKTISGA